MIYHRKISEVSEKSLIKKKKRGYSMFVNVDFCDVIFLLATVIVLESGLSLWRCRFRERLRREMDDHVRVWIDSNIGCIRTCLEEISDEGIEQRISIFEANNDPLEKLKFLNGLIYRLSQAAHDKQKEAILKVAHRDLSDALVLLEIEISRSADNEGVKQRVIERLRTTLDTLESARNI